MSILFKYLPSLSGETPEGGTILSSRLFCEYLLRMTFVKNLIQVSQVSDSERK